MSTGTSFALVGLGGALGGVARYALTDAFPDDGAGFPWTVWAINVAGSFLLGLLVAGVVGRRAAPAWVRPALGTGVLGGFTTFSAYAHAVDVLATGERPATAGAYLLASLVAGFVAAALGVAVGATLPARISAADRAGGTADIPSAEGTPVARDLGAAARPGGDGEVDA